MSIEGQDDSERHAGWCYRLDTLIIFMSILCFWLAIPPLRVILLGWLAVFLFAAIMLVFQGVLFLILWALGRLPSRKQQDKGADLIGRSPASAAERRQSAIPSGLRRGSGANNSGRRDGFA